MVASAPIDQLFRWAAWLSLHGPQLGDRLDLGFDRVMTAVHNKFRDSGRLPLRWWNTPPPKPPAKPLTPKEQFQLQIDIETEKKRLAGVLKNWPKEPRTQ